MQNIHAYSRLYTTVVEPIDQPERAFAMSSQRSSGYNATMDLSTNMASSIGSDAIRSCPAMPVEMSANGGGFGGAGASDCFEIPDVVTGVLGFLGDL